jgi:hypothetical protein
MLTALSTMAEDLNYTYSAPTTNTVSGGPSVVAILIYFALITLVIAAMWKVYTKAKRPGWAALIPIYNSLQLLWMAGRPWWWIFLLMIPLVNIVVAAIVMNDIAKSFGKGTGTTLLLFFLPFIGFPILGFGKATYQGPAALSGAGATPPPAAGAAPQPPVTPAV